MTIQIHSSRLLSEKSSRTGEVDASVSWLFCMIKERSQGQKTPEEIKHLSLGPGPSQSVF